MTYEEFINREMRVWGEDYIFDLMDRGYEAIQLISDSSGIPVIRWSWRLTQPRACATVSRGSIVGFTPVFLTDRALSG